ncbi:hypothetical protein [Streptomyces sp. HD]|nr:hypothetical protein [Streptomyces sp. HD]MDC0766914.1 hypothetical protein [Streptomyces sp. HD]
MMSQVEVAELVDRPGPAQHATAFVGVGEEGRQVAGGDPGAWPAGGG